ncbi:hypothetical protein [Montanilutibacter psychrotolerans]|uniref:Uncharacterized protein n=1 Tax=Montanilutibacter psychrotolerans TaxID=1327343 RepID=A0A3M8T0W4_9GAMM|nr:hypothetical protein [Lysobacter psychrotolerans]RNF84332.1 hypothetical protein EER27_08090 [Lysobacter psychrotolerans]
MSSPWSAQQREWLHALGHPVMVLAGAHAAASDDDDAEAARALPLEGVRLRESGADRDPQGDAPGGSAMQRGSDRIAPSVVDRAVPSPRRPPATLEADGERPTGRRVPEFGAPPGDADPRLHRALLRATGQATTRAAEKVLLELGVDAASLRGDAAAKRALWPRLRRQRPPRWA